jgi:hypothetical protein
LYDPTFELHRTHQFPIGTTGIATGTVFPDRTKALTVSVTVKRTGADPAGLIFELGSSSVGLAIWFQGSDDKIHAAAGSPVAAPAFDVEWTDTVDTLWTDTADTFWQDLIGGTGYDGVTCIGPAPPQGQIVRIVFSVIPSSGKGRLWINGKLEAHDDALAAFPSGWADTGDGAVGEVDGTVITRVAVGDRITLTGAAVISPVNVYQNQRPRQFFEVA